MANTIHLLSVEKDIEKTCLPFAFVSWVRPDPSGLTA